MSFRDFRTAPFQYLVTRSRLAGRILALISSARTMTRSTHTWPQLVSFTFEAAGGFLRPLQVQTEIETAMSEIEKTRPRFILEIGTAKGGTFFLFSRAASPNALLISLDLPAGRWGGGYSNWKTSVFRRLLLPGQSAHFIRSNSHDPSSLQRVREILGGNPLDLLYIDGDHSYEGVKLDFDMYSSLVRPDGLIVFHDIAVHKPEYDCHVDQLWGELKVQFPGSEIIRDVSQGWAGIGILQNSTHPV